MVVSRTNLFESFTYESLHQDFERLIFPFKSQVDNIERGFVRIGHTGTVYDEKISDVEGFLRLLWGLSHYYLEHDYDSFFHSIIKGIKVGTNPSHEYYWGDILNYTQLMVELTSLSIFAINHKQFINVNFTSFERDNLMMWLDLMNGKAIHKNNWMFFRVISNMALSLVFNKNRMQQIDEDLSFIDSLYLGDGWYYDGRKRQKDYYNAFAFHYYSLLYAVYFEKQDPVRSKIFKKRAILFANQYQEFFDDKGRSLPYGRSLIYRFATVSFWAVLIWADLKEYPLENAKFHIENNLRYWFSQNIVDSSGYLNLGYAYQNLRMSEEYNGPGSPYWSFKTFILLSISKTHPMWRVTSSKVKNYTGVSSLSGMIIKNSQISVKGYPIDLLLYHHVNGIAKYERFVYSSNFGFNIPLGTYGLQENTQDNTLLLSERDDYYRMCIQSEVMYDSKGYILKKSKPWCDVSVDTWVIPGHYWHIRIHKIKTERDLHFIDSGFSAPSDGSFSVEETSGKILLGSDAGLSAIYNLVGDGILAVSDTVVNSNILHPRVRYPYFKGDLDKGEHFLIHCFYGNDSHFEEELLNLPTVTIFDDIITVFMEGTVIKLNV